MARHSMISLVALATLMCLGLLTPASAQGSAEPPGEWTPEFLSDGQPNIQGLWN